MSKTEKEKGFNLIYTDRQGMSRSDWLRWLVNDKGVDRTKVRSLLGDIEIDFEMMVIDAMGDNIDIWAEEVLAVVARAEALGYTS